MSVNGGRWVAADGESVVDGAAATGVRTRGGWVAEDAANKSLLWLRRR